MKKKPKIFIGSSSESIDLAVSVQENLEQVADITVWNQGVFDLSKYALQSILDILNDCDYGVFVFFPDDISKIRDKNCSTIRDNVILELGIFIGKLGQENSFIIIPRDAENLHLPTDLLGITIADFDNKRDDNNIVAALGPACNKIRRQLKNSKKYSEEKQLSVNKKNDNNLVKRDEFSKVLLAKLSDPNVKKIVIITYTSEVDASNINRFHINGKKHIEVYKRSILRDLKDQQECNLMRIAKGSNVSLWDKKESSINASKSLEKSSTEQIIIKQYLYDTPPSKRAYYFDDEEAIIAYYKIEDDIYNMGGSVYKGITEQDAIKVDRKSDLGSFLLDELDNQIESLKRCGSRSFKDELDILEHGTVWKGNKNLPCTNLKAVFFDLDGVLYDSLPYYVEAWQKAFSENDIKFSEQKVYLEEGKRGKETIISYLEEIEHRFDEELVNKIYKRKCEIFQQFG